MHGQHDDDRKMTDGDAQTTPAVSSMAEHEEMMRAHKERMLWTYFANITLGLWLLVSPATFGEPDAFLVYSDIIAGVVVVAFGTWALFHSGDFWGRWAVCFAGIWLLFAPLIAWAPEPASYANDTLVGALLIAFSVLVPMMPGKAHHMAMMAPGPEVPPGWSYNPSTFWQRGLIIALALVSFVAARYMAAFQLGHIDSVWDPFFNTESVLLSDVSKAWPISDAGLGALAYLLEALSGFMGGAQRWRSMPWMVLMFGVLVVPLGVVSIFLVIAQPVMVGEWCVLCLFTAAFMLVMIPLAVDEILAMFQFMKAAKREGQPLVRTFFVGGTLRQYEHPPSRSEQRYACPMHPDVIAELPGRCPHCGMELSIAGSGKGAGKDERSPHWPVPLHHLLPPMTWGVTFMTWGVTLPWNLVAVTIIGLWVMAAPDLFGVGRQAPMADSDHLIGALIAVVAVIAWAEILRPARYLNILFGAWIVVAPWLLAGGSMPLAVSDTLAGAAVITLSIPRGAVLEHYGEWTKRII